MNHAQATYNRIRRCIEMTGSIAIRIYGKRRTYKSIGSFCVNGRALYIVNRRNHSLVLVSASNIIWSD